MKKLTLIDCKESLNREIKIGSAYIAGKDCKRFVFHVWDNEYRVQVKKHGPYLWKTVDSGQAVEELLEVYNKL